MKRQADEKAGGIEKQAKLSMQDLYKVPTTDELQQILHTERSGSVGNSDILRLQISELLSEVSLKELRKKQMNDYIQTLSTTLRNFKQSESINLNDLKSVSKLGIKLPLNLGKQTPVQGNFRFRPPEEVQVIGSYACGTCLKRDCHVDIAVTLPQGFVHAKDHLDHRYYTKRALYLACIAKQLSTHQQLVDKIYFQYERGNHVKPILIIVPKGKLSSHLQLRIHTHFEDHHVKRHHLHMGANNVRSGRTNDTADVATPYYNMAMLQDMTLTQDALLMTSFFHENPGLRDGLKLLKIWLHLRQLDQGYGCFSGYIMTMFVIYLLRIKKLQPTMSGFQMFRYAVVQLAEVRWNEKGITLCTDPIQKTSEVLGEFHRHFPVVFVGEKGDINICREMTVNTLNRVKYEAQQAMKYIDTPGVKIIDVLFTQQMPFLSSFDQFIVIKNMEQLAKSVTKCGLQHSLVDHSGNIMRTLLGKILQILERAVGRRVIRMAHDFPIAQTWLMNEKAPTWSQGSNSMRIGLTLNQETAQSVLEKGPAADSPEAKEFRSLWGEKSELRRFQDGSICEAVVWSANTAEERRQVLGAQVATYVLKLHADINEQHISIIHNQLDCVLKYYEKRSKRAKPNSHGDKLRVYPSIGTGEEEMVDYMEVLQQLCKSVRGVDLPLAIHAVHAITPASRYTEVVPVRPATVWYKGSLSEGRRFPHESAHAFNTKMAPPYMPIPTVVCMLEGSGKWPDDAQAVRRMKAAFLSRFFQQLSNLSGVTAVHCNVARIDLVMKGFPFRLILGYSHEIVLLRRYKSEDGRVNFADNEASCQLQLQLHSLPQLSSTIIGLHHLFSSYSEGVRLAKRWVACHMMLGDHVKHEALELIIAQLYLRPQPYAVPGSGIVCFLRFLQFMSTFDWKTQPLLVNLNDEFKAEDIEEINTHFQTQRAQLPIMFIATPTDKTTSQWTRDGPSAPVLSRLALLAREAHLELTQQLLDPKPDVDYKRIFRPQLSVFDIVIHLQPQSVTRNYQALDLAEGSVVPKYGQIPADRLREIPAVEFEPVQFYLRDIREAFGDLALFFYDQYGGTVIGVLFNPRACQSKPFSEEHVALHMPDTTGSDVTLIPNVEGILSDLETLGAGLVSRIEKHAENWPF